MFYFMDFESVFIGFICVFILILPASLLIMLNLCQVKVKDMNKKRNKITYEKYCKK